MTDTPTARRASAPGWRDPRLWIGVGLVAASVLVGALVLGTSDDTVAVWAATDAMGPGSCADRRRPDRTPGGLRRRGRRRALRRRRRAAAVGRPACCTAWPRASCCPAPRSARSETSALRQVPVSVASDQVPGSVGEGDVVDVYLRPSTRSGCTGTPVCSGRPVLAGRDRAGRAAARPGVRLGRRPDAGPGGARRRRPPVLPAARHDRRPVAHRGRPGLTVVVVLVVAAGAAWESPVLELVARRPGLVVLKRCVDVDDLLAAGSAGQADAALVALDAPGLDQSAVDLLHRHQVRVVAVAGGGSPDADPCPSRPRRCRRASPATTSWRGSLDLLESDDERAVVPADDPPDVEVRPSSSSGRVVVVWGPAGAPGRTPGRDRARGGPGRARAAPPRWSTPTPTPPRSPSSSVSSTRCRACSVPPG